MFFEIDFVWNYNFDNTNFLKEKLCLSFPICIVYMKNYLIIFFARNSLIVHLRINPSAVRSGVSIHLCLSSAQRLYDILLLTA